MPDYIVTYSKMWLISVKQKLAGKLARITSNRFVCFENNRKQTKPGKKFQEKEGMKIIQLSETASVIKIQAQKLCEMAAHNIRNQHPSGLHL